jgi:hypothetical protein
MVALPVLLIGVPFIFGIVDWFMTPKTQGGMRSLDGLVRLSRHS